MKKYSLTANELSLWLKYIEHQVGFILPSQQVSWVKGIIERYLLAQQVTSTEFLQQITNDNQLYHQLFDDILIPHTQFFRHLPTFDFVEHYVANWREQYWGHGALANDEPPKSNLPISPVLTAWSVGCATGQEVVSVALSIAKQLGESGRFKVYGSDFNQQALAYARQGLYEIAESAYIPQRYHAWLKFVTLGKVQVVDSVRAKLQFFSKNLVDYEQTMPVLPKQCQLILCNNVLIYFRQFEQRDVVQFLLEYLADDGILLLGVGELPQFNHPQLVKLPLSHINGYRKVNAPAWLKQRLKQDIQQNIHKPMSFRD
ncbi:MULTISPECIES: CheR family methyltransferase [unclassified Moraxella]|uniref:CheR family methyltransferase n=1 Tax=unclassified Moraxella TaxID=2685852 RepID=UPI003AF7A52E